MPLSHRLFSQLYVLTENVLALLLDNKTTKVSLVSGSSPATADMASPACHVRDSVKQIDETSWLIGSKHILRYVEEP
jgi:hypothetical protein